MASAVAMTCGCSAQSTRERPWIARPPRSRQAGVSGRFGIEFTNGDAPGVRLTATKARKGGK